VIIAIEYMKKPENQDALHCAMHPSFDDAMRRFLLAYHAGVSVAGLPGKERRNDLEGLSWQPVCARGWAAVGHGSVPSGMILRLELES
jgi:hypothetical protein